MEKAVPVVGVVGEVGVDLENMEERKEGLDEEEGVVVTAGGVFATRAGGLPDGACDRVVSFPRAYAMTPATKVRVIFGFTWTRSSHTQNTVMPSRRAMLMTNLALRELSSSVFPVRIASSLMLPGRTASSRSAYRMQLLRAESLKLVIWSLDLPPCLTVSLAQAMMVFSSTTLPSGVRERRMERVWYRISCHIRAKVNCLWPSTIFDPPIPTNENLWSFAIWRAISQFPVM
mmetsp:Transcript_24569/g.40435  ORF Transcript_24569/g.40435 Transcript_24569/m.40435 type:complete len:231 (-) Transcript_24569:1148-1840(-)